MFKIFHNIKTHSEGIQLIIGLLIGGAAILSILTQSSFVSWLITFVCIGVVIALFSLGGGTR